jgi:hypothetical protein
MALPCLGQSLLAFPNLLPQPLLLITPLAFDLAQSGLSGIPQLAGAIVGLAPSG